MRSTLHEGFRKFVFFYGTLLVLGVLLGLTTAATMTSAYGLTIVSFVVTGELLVLIYRRLPDKSYTRAGVGLFIIAGMAYSASATALPEVIGSTVNMTILRPAIAYPFIAGLRFIPIPVLIFIFLVVLPIRDNRGLARHRLLRMSYLFLGVLSLLGAALIGLADTETLRIWRAGLSIRWTLLAGELFICGVNLALFLAAYRFFNTTTITGYTRFLSRCAMGYLLIALTAAIVNRHWHEIDKHYLDMRQAHSYRIQNTNAASELQNWLQAHAADVGPDLMSLSSETEFLRALRTQEFYKRDFDEAFQMSRKAVIFGYKNARDTQAKRPSFVLVRFPAELTTALRFELVDATTKVKVAQ